MGEQFVEGEGEAAFQCRRGAHAGAQGYVAAIDGIEALDLHAGGHQLAHYAVDVAEVHGLGPLRVVDAEGTGHVHVDGIEVDGRGVVWTYGGRDAHVDGAGEDEAAVIVGVLADEVDAAGGGKELAVAAETRGKGLLEDASGNHDA